MKPRLIGLVGYAGSGKSLAADCLAPHGYYRTRFAAPLKDMLRSLGLTQAEVDGHLKEVPCELLGGKTPRHAMITLGTEWGRNLIDYNLWVRVTMHKVNHSLSVGDKKVVIDDVRFPNEAQAIRDAGGTIWRIDRVGVGAGSSHISETGQEDIEPDVIVINDGDPESFKQSVLTALNCY